MTERRALPQPLIVLIAVACFVVVVAGMKAAGGILLPLMFAVFLSVLVWPLVNWMVRHRVPRVLAIIVALLLVTATMLAGTAIVTDAMAEFTAQIPSYQAPLKAQADLINSWLLRQGLDPIVELDTIFQPDIVLGLVRGVALGIAGILSNVVLVVLVMAFILLEASELGTKLVVVFGEREGQSWVTDAGDRVQRYLGIKTFFSALTGLLLGLFLAWLGLSFPVMWGFLAFTLNFVPAIGSIVASIPPIALALVEFGPAGALVVALAYLAVNFSIGNVIEPRVMGRRLGLSPFVVILSLLFWGYIWGPGGTLLGVPLTVIVKLVLESSPNTRWLAMLLAGASEAVAIAEGQEVKTRSHS